jgi:hypothetical protein
MSIFDQTQTETSNQVMRNMSMNNSANIATATQYRLDTTPTMMKFEKYLTGLQEVQTMQPDGSYIMQWVRTGDPFINAKGVQGLLGWINSNFNPSVVQANVTKDQYDDLMYWRRIEIVKIVANHSNQWEIKDENMQFVIDTSMNLIELFLTRPIDNKERESYDTIRTNESRERTGGGLFKSG